MDENKETMTPEEEKGMPENETVSDPAENTENVVEETASEEKPLKGEKEKKKTKKAEAELKELRNALSEKDAAFADLNDKYLRLCAEYDNFRKRSAKEREAAYGDATCDVLTQILPVLDNLERAAAYNVEGNEESPLGKGLEMTLKSFSELLSKLGVSEIEAEGKTFDPNVHNAVMHVDDETLGDNVVVEVFMKGYAKGDKVLRYSMVKVAN